MVVRSSKLLRWFLWVCGNGFGESLNAIMPCDDRISYWTSHQACQLDQAVMNIPTNQIYLAQLACSFMQAKPFPLGALRFTEHRSHFQVT